MPEKNKIVSIGGSVECAVKGEYSIDVKAVLTEAWQLTLKSRMSINLSLFFVLFFGMIVSFIASSFFGGIEQVIKDPELLQLVNIIVTIAVWPFIAGIEMMGVWHAIKKPTQAKMVFSFLHRGSWVALCALLTSLLISIIPFFASILSNIGFELVILTDVSLIDLLVAFFTVILTVILSLTIPLVVEKKLTPIQAIILSITALRFKLVPLLAIYSFLFMALISLAFPIALLIESSFAPIAIMVFLFGLSYLVPWYFNVKGVLYREIFGVYVDENSVNKDLDVNGNKVSDHTGSDDTFSA